MRWESILALLLATLRKYAKQESYETEQIQWIITLEVDHPTLGQHVRKEHPKLRRFQDLKTTLEEHSTLGRTRILFFVLMATIN